MATEQEYTKFKSLLEYFVAHLEYVENKGSISHCGYEKYLQRWVESQEFKKTGTGYNGQKIQNQIADWEQYSVGKIAINCTPQFGGNYKTRLCYLNWVSTGLNVTAQWSDVHIVSLALENYDGENKWITVVSPIFLNDLGLYDDQSPNDILKTFFDSFERMLLDHKQSALNETGNNDSMITAFKELLKDCQNLILTGAPGTGKTYLAKQIAYALTGDNPENSPHVEFCQFHPSFDYTDFVEGLRPVDKGNGNIGFERKDGIFKEFCKKAISKSVNNFDEAYNKFSEFLSENYSKVNPLELKTPNNASFRVFLNTKGSLSLLTGQKNEVQGSLTSEKIKTFLTEKPYEFWEGYYLGVIDYLTKNFNLTSIADNNEQKYVFIIDEINRGDISKIFGELFYAVDPGYRGQDGKVKTQYSNLISEDDPYRNGFYIPKNVYIIGTMNDIDRSVESMDFAIRRRFTWKEIEAKDAVEMWDDTIPEYKDEALAKMTRLNEVIEQTESLSKAFHIGPAYFLKLKDYKGDFQKLWDLHILPLLKEYLRGTFDTESTLKNLSTAYFNSDDSETEE